VPARFVARKDGSFGFAMGRYNRSQPLVIDPVLTYSTYLGGSGVDEARGVAVDRFGHAYVTGVTNLSNNFPTKNPFQPASGGSYDAFVAELSANGQSLIYSTYLGGSGEDIGNAIAVDATGAAYVTGHAASTNFPTKNALQPNLAGTEDAFVTKLAPGGGSLVYSTYLGGSDRGLGASIAVDSQGEAYVVGQTRSTDFPTKNAFQPNSGGGFDAFVAKLSADGRSLVFSTYLGGSGDDGAAGIALDRVGNAYVAGGTASTNFPTKNALHAALAGIYNAFVTELSPAGAPVYSTYFGGSDSDEASSIAVDPTGEVYVGGYTTSPNFPTQAAISPMLGGTSDGFVFSLAPGGQSLVYSTYLGGSGSDAVEGIAVDHAGRAYVVGGTESTDFPTKNPISAVNAGGADAFLAVIHLPGYLSFSTYLGGKGDDFGRGVAVDGTGAAYVVGSTASPDFPTLFPLQPKLAGTLNAFMTKIRGFPLTGATPNDFNGDDKTDFGIYYNNVFFVKPSGGGPTLVQPLGSPGAIPVVGDFVFDGKADFGVYQNNTFYIKPSNGGPMIVQPWGGPGAIPVLGDFDGDQVADFGVYQNNTFYIKPSNGGPTIVQPWGVPGSIPVVGDFDGDGKADFGFYYHNTFYIKESGGGIIVQPWGVPGATPVVGDYDGDGKTDFGFYYNGTFYIKPSNGGPAIVQPWGLPGAIPIEGDYDGDGKTDFAIYYKNIFYAKPSAGGPPIVQPWGVPGSLPLPVPLPFLNAASRAAVSPQLSAATIVSPGLPPLPDLIVPLVPTHPKKAAGLIPELVDQLL
jgi:hypothetical protein